MTFYSIDLFSGLGGNAYAFKSFATPQLYCEIDQSAVQILQAAMAKRLIAEAPVHNNVVTIKTNPAYKAAKQLRPLLISGSWPCQGDFLSTAAS
jgi:site-specific DNA-cytosine methylase